jgi:hypothetical protein
MLRSVGSVAIEVEALKQTSDNQQTTIDTLNEQVSLLNEEASLTVEKMLVLEADNVILKEKLTFVREQLIAIPGVLTRFGTVRDMEAGNGFVTFEIDVKEWLTGEKAMTYLIEEFDLSIEDAAKQLPNGYYIKDLPDEPVIYKLDKASYIKLLADSELYEADLAKMIELVTSNVAIEHYPMFYFYVVDGEIIEIDEQYIP